MTLVRFLRTDGSLDREVEAQAGTNLLDFAQAQAQLQPALARAATVAAQHATLLVGVKLQALADAITSAQSVTAMLRT